MIVGLTGGIGSGKSAAAKIFVELGIDVIDADELSKNVLIENQKAKKIFIEKFGQKYIKSNDEIDRELLREDIFKDDKKRLLILSILSFNFDESMYALGPITIIFLSDLFFY